VKREIPIHHFIVVDRFSTDETINTIKKYSEPIVVYSQENLAKARSIGIDLVDTEYFVFLDDDVELPIGWFNRLTGFIEHRVGAVHEQIIWFGLVGKHSKFIPARFVKWESATLKRGLVTDLSREGSLKARGYTFATIIKTSIVKDWKPSSIICAYEDYLLTRHVLEKGYIWRIVNNYSTIHYKPRNLREHLRNVRWSIAGARITGFLTFKTLIAQLIKENVNAFKECIKFKEPRILGYTALMKLVEVDAYLRWKKFLVMKRQQNVAQYKL